MLFVFLLLSHVSSLYSVDINPLSDIWFTNTFSHLVGCLLVLLLVSCAMQSLFSLMQSHLFIFAFVSLAWGDISRKIPLGPMSRSILPMFSSRNSMVSGLAFKSLIHFEFDFYVGCEVVVQCDYFPCSCPAFPTPVMEETILSPLYVLCSFVINQLSICVWVCFWALNSVP